MSGDEFAPEDPHETPSPTGEERTWAMLCHLSGFAGYLGVVPFASIIGPLIIWLLKKDSSSFVDEHGKESLNFQITASIAYAVCLMMFLVVIGVFLLPLLGIWIVVLIIVAAIKANNGEYLHYPLTIRFVR